MDRTHFRVLYREFLFRMVDRDLLSAQAQGDVSKLLGRFAAILIWVSLPFAGMATMIVMGETIAPVHRVLATTMLIVVILCVLSWDSLFPDRRDLFVLTPLGVRAPAIFAARFASLLVAMSTAVALFNALPAVIFSFVFVPGHFNLLQVLFSANLYRAAAAYVIAVLASGTFVLLCVTLIQAATAQLPRRISLRLSGLLQIAAFCAAVSTYFLQPSWSRMNLAAQETALWYPSYWFVGLFHQVNGYPAGPESLILAKLARQAWLALTLTGTCAVLAVLASCATVLRRIGEQPDLIPVQASRMFPWSFGHSPRTAILQWTARTLLRSRQHRVVAIFYAGIGFAAVILFLQVPRVHVISSPRSIHVTDVISIPMIGATFVMLIAWMVGVRAAFALPVEVRANWIFRVAFTGSPADALTATRLSLLLTGLVPPVLCSAVLIWLWPWPAGVQHVLIMTFLGSVLAAFLVRGFHKIPFTCSYLPGTSHVHITLALCILLGFNIIFWAAKFEARALLDPLLFVKAAALLAASVALSWWQLYRAQLPTELVFQQEPDPAVMTLGLEHVGPTG